MSGTLTVLLAGQVAGTIERTRHTSCVSLAQGR